MNEFGPPTVGQNEVLDFGQTSTTAFGVGEVHFTDTSSAPERSGHPRFTQGKEGGRKEGSQSNRIDTRAREKNWNYYKENENVYDIIYWDSFDNHAQDEARGSSEKEVDANLFINVIYR